MLFRSQKLKVEAASSINFQLLLSHFSFRKESLRIGEKSRNGEYGAAFAGNISAAAAGDGVEDIYCCRPGMRIWKADRQGKVLLTYKFKPSLGTSNCQK